MTKNDGEIVEETREQEIARIPLYRGDPSRWPRHVRGISVEESGYFGVDKDGNLHWDGTRIEMKKISLRWPERTIAISGVTIALFMLILEGWQWGCQLRASSTDWCPPPSQGIGYEN
ncbi:MAG: hypothetical protein VYD87_16725 [Pseudomonadota bacterium]|nr:hypothetical protein [Pseudomonadota bacterium]